MFKYVNEVRYVMVCRMVGCTRVTVYSLWPPCLLQDPGDYASGRCLSPDACNGGKRWVYHGLPALPMTAHWHFKKMLEAGLGILDILGIALPLV